MGSSLAWYDEIASALLAGLTFEGASLAVLKGAHICWDQFLKLQLQGQVSPIIASISNLTEGGSSRF
jgi:TRAP-type C4-dicarboxylate transport system permease small subunit